MISLSACASLSPSSVDTGALPEHVKAKSSNESDLGSSAQDHHTGFCPRESMGHNETAYLLQWKFYLPQLRPDPA